MTDDAIREAAIDEAIVALLSSEDPDLDHDALVRNNREVVRKVRSGIPHSGDCTNECHTCFVCLVAEYEHKARMVLSAYIVPTRDRSSP